MPPWMQFVACSAGVFICYLAYGILLEKITSAWKQSGGIHLGWFLTFFQCTCYFILGSAQMTLFPAKEREKSVATMSHHDKKEVMPFRGYFAIGTLSMLTIGLSNVSTEYLSYPTQVLFKSAKPLAVMLLSLFILKKRYSLMECAATLLFTFGLMAFSAADKSVSAASRPLGIVIICTALLVDGIIGNVQQKMFKMYACSINMMLVKTKAVGALWTFFISLATGQFSLAFAYTAEKPAIFLWMILFSTAGFFGEAFVLALIKQFGALVTVMTTSFRKLLTILISFMLFPKPWVLGHAAGVAMVFSGIFLNIYVKNKAVLQRWLARQAGRKEKAERSSDDDDDDIV